mmetsp:Transcript_21/g.59  ORF Transcript_21/g.59 Transcript_21/m.59 type:complete len:117 (-) Transcript_21:289-639(-)
MMHSEQQQMHDGPLVLAYFDGDRPVFRPAAAAPVDDDEAIFDEDAVAFSMPTFSGALGRPVMDEIDDEEAPVYRSLNAMSLSPAEPAMPGPPGLCRQRGFGQPGMLDQMLLSDAEY